jgi:uncharacterized coiled-coil DUF342 family protein
MTQYKLVVDCSTGNQEYVALTAAEIAELDQLAAATAEEQTAREAEAAAKAALKESAKAKLVSGEPLTDEEAAVLVI